MRTRFDFPKAASAISASVSCGSAATQIAASRVYRSSIIIANYSNQTVFIGYGSDVTVTNGLPLAASASLTEERWNGEIWGITESGSADVRVLELL